MISSFLKKINLKPEVVSIAKNSSWLILDKIFRIFLGLIVGAWVARYLGPEDFGELNYILAFLGLFQVIAKLGLDGIVVRELSQSKLKKSSIIGTTFILRFVAGFFLWLTSIFVMYILSDGDIDKVKLVAIAGFSIVFQFADTVDLWFQSKSESKRVVKVKLCGYLFSNSLRVFFIVLEASLSAFFFAIFIEFLLCSLGLIYIFFKNWNKGRLDFNPMVAKSFLLESWPFILSAASIVIYSRIDLFFVNYYLTKSELGLYAAAASLSGLFSFIPVTISTSINPYLAKSKKKSKEEYERIIRVTFAIFSSLGWVLCMAVYFLSPNIVYLLFGNDYIEAASILAVLIFSNLFVNMGVAQSLWILNEGLSKVSLYKTISGAISCIVLNMILVPKFGLTGAAISTISSQAISSVFSNFIFAKNIFYLQINSLFFRFKSLRL